MIKFIALLLLSCAFNLYALTPVSGTFEAIQSCSAYSSKKNKTNPGNLTLRIGTQYKIKEINKNPPDWFRIEMAEQHNALRWVNISCGSADYTPVDNKSCDPRAGLADSYVLALSSQPGFCETYGYEAGKPECRKLSKNSFQANHLTLHGLWPNQDRCGHRYGFCNTKPKSSHCGYPEVNLSVNVAENLKKMMPSYQYGSCLERHEWNKHGSCSLLTSDDYFTLAMRLATEANQSELGIYLSDHSGDVIKLSELRALISTTFGEENSDKIYLGCKDGRLVDIYVTLPALIPANESLGSLISKAPAYSSNDSCPSKIVISNFSKESWF